MLKDLKGLFFDLDDTLINFGGVTKISWELACERLNEVYPDLGIDTKKLAAEIYKVNEAFFSDEELRKTANGDPLKARRGIVVTSLNNLGIEINDEAIDFLVNIYSECKEESVYMFPNVHETLTELKDRGYKLVLITNGNGERQRGKIARFDLEKYFDLIWIEGERPYGKPDVRAYQSALDACGISAEEACMVGDNYLWEVETPIKYGLKGVWVNAIDLTLPENYEIEPDLIVENVSELLNW